jgi:hypothetical protein
LDLAGPTGLEPATSGVTGHRSDGPLNNRQLLQATASVERGDIAGIAILSGTHYHQQMKTITVKLPEQTLQRLKDEAQATGRSVAAIIRERIEISSDGQSVHALVSDLAGSLAGSRRAATNQRRRFGRS